MSLEVSLKEICENLLSNKSSERKRSADTLKDFLTRNAAPDLLSDNTRKNQGFSWNNLFDHINEYLLKETEKTAFSKTFYSVTYPLFSSILHLSVAGSIKGKAYIKCDKLMEACLFVLNNKRLADAVGDAYLTLLYKYVLPSENYPKHITPSVWEDLLDISTTACFSTSSELDDFIRLKLLWLVIKNAGECVQFSISLRNSLNKITQYFHKLGHNKKALEVVTDIMNLTLEMLYLESRLSACKFAENNLPLIFQFYEQNLDLRKKSQLFKLINISIAIHHPLGHVQSEECALAHNWDDWNKCLNSIMEIICLETTYIQKTYKQNCNILNECSNFARVAANIYFVIFKTSAEQNITNSDNEKSAKKPKLTMNRFTVFEDLLREFQKNHIPWTHIIHMYVKNYGRSVSSNYYKSLLNILEQLVNSNNMQQVSNVFENLTCLVLRNILSLSDNSQNIWNEPIISLWNSCVRNSTSVTPAQRAIHAVMQSILSTNLLQYCNVKPLFILYFEKGMPVNDHSVNTLISLFKKFFAKSCHDFGRIKCVTWFTNGEITKVEVSTVRELFITVLSNENVGYVNKATISESDNLHNTLFETVDKSILFSNFEFEIAKHEARNQSMLKDLEINNEVNAHLSDFLQEKLLEYKLRLEGKDVELLEYLKILRIALVYFDIMLTYYFHDENIAKMISRFKNFLKIMFTISIDTLKSDVQIRDKNVLLESLQLILLEKYNTLLNFTVRECTDNDFFHCLNDILVSDVPPDDDESDPDMSFNALKHNCVLLIAAYCKKQQDYREELLELILNSKLYNFSCQMDVESALKCIRLLNQPDVEDASLELTFTLMRSMCKDLFRDSKATKGIIELLIQMIDKVWLHSDNMRRNCLIMVKSYLHRCESKYYPPKVVALVYKCAAKITMLNYKGDSQIELNFKDVLINNLNANFFSMRLYCSYLINEISEAMSEDDMELCFTILNDMFTVSVPEENETTLKDELKNRTASVLNAYFRLAKNKPILIHRVVVEILMMQRQKSLDKHLVTKTLKIIIEDVTQKSIHNYLDKHILFILQCWLEKQYVIVDLPLYLFLGSDDDDQISMKYMKWLVSADILWRHRGLIKNSDAMKKFKQNIAETAILEKSFSNIIVLSLPYIVKQKYGLRSSNEQKYKDFIEAASKMFHQTREILKNEKWTNLFVENMGELVLLTALHLKDHADAQKVFEVHILQNNEIYSYSKEIFCAILKYFSELIDGNIMEYFCENQPRAVLKVLFVLWENVISENLFEFKVVFLHTFVTFIENIPLGFPSDSILCNFAISSIASAMIKAERDNELSVLAKALYITLVRFNSHKVIIHETILSKILSILFIKKENSECERVLNFVVRNFKGLADLYAMMTEAGTNTYNSEDQVTNELEKYLANLSNGSTATLSKMGKFLNTHKKIVKDAFNKLDGKGFSDEYENSVLHKVIVALCAVIKTSTSEKVLIEASNCLTEIGTYDLKTFVTVPPSDTKQLIDAKPTHYFAITTVKSLLEIIFDENPTLSYKAAKALYNLMKFKDGSLINIDSGMVNGQILKCLTTATCESFAQYSVHNISTQWVPNDNEEHLQWIERITLSLLNALESSSNYLNSLLTVCDIKPSICRKILPALVGLIVEHSSEEQVQMFGQEMNQVFNNIWDKSFYDSAVNSEDHTVSKNSSLLSHDQKMIVHYLLDVVNTIRLQRNHSKIRKLREPDALRHMKLEYDKLAWAATLADKNITAIYYAELWAVAENGGVPPASPERTANLAGGENLQKILRNCFVCIGELDAIDGCGTAHLTSEVEKRKHLLNTGQYSDALLLHDIALSSGPQVDNGLQQGVVMSLHKSGMHHLALQYIKSFPENDDLNDVKYDCLSYLGDWSEIVDTKELEETTKQPVWDVDVVIKSFRYACLKECLNARPCEAFGVRLMNSLDKAKLASSKLCRILNMENCQSVYKVVSNLHLFRDIEDYYSVRCGRTNPTELLNRWQVEKLPSYKDFRHLESLMSQRSLILEHAAKHYESLSSDIIDLQLQYVDMGLSNQRIQMSHRLLQSVKNLQQTEKVMFAESQIAWAKGHKEIALALLHDVVVDDTPHVKLSAMCLRQYGLWMAECRRENAREIISKYLEKSLEALNKTDHAETRYKVYHDIAKFADAEYKQIVSYMNSTVFENKVKCIENMKGIAASFKVPHKDLTKDEKKAFATNDRFMKLDEDEVLRTRAEKESFLNLAMRYYLLSLRHSEETILSIFRVISLWFDNPCFEFEVGFEANLQDYLQAVPSWKFIMVLPQLAPRITTEDNDFAKYLKQILDRCASDHPHHTLPILFNLKNSDKDNCILNASGGSGSSMRTGRSRVAVEPRIAAADDLINELAKRANLKSIVAQMERLCDAFISFAYFSSKVNSTRPQPIPSAEGLSKLKNMAALPIPTVTLPIAKNGDYSNVPRITEFGSHFELVGGINCPKKITCRSSDGKCSILLIKGEDDLRQDAVMQQVFSIVNKLLENNPITRKNKLLIRTYKVVPMSRRSGVLEWCEGTMPLGAYLMEAHLRYRPKDITPSAARTKLKICHENRKSNQEKLRVFMGILGNFKPVFHNFFTEHYHDPITWYERRLAYTRSIASSSMVGYILGLGDRHVQNILIDKITAEVIHIDLGIAFDQGKALPTPETIPFRLTQDIIAGFGCCGVEGIFRRCCEKTMQLLRDNQETLLTILEVLLCDPLYSWTLKGPLKNSSVYSLRGSEPASSGLAERALLSVGGKLSGAEGGAPAAVSVAGQVARLVAAATDPANLSRLFPGWQPYL